MLMYKLKCRACDAAVYSCPEIECDGVFHHMTWIAESEPNSGCSLKEMTRDQVMRVGSDLDQLCEELSNLVEAFIETCEAHKIAFVPHQWTNSLDGISPPSGEATNLLDRAYGLLGKARGKHDAAFGKRS